MLRALLITAALIIIFAGIKQAASLVVPFLLAVFLAVLVSPPFLHMKRAGVPVSMALVILFACLAVLCLLAVTILRTSLDQFIEQLPFYEVRIKSEVAAFAVLLEQWDIDSPERIVADTLNPEFAMNYAGNVARALSGMLGQALIIFVVAAFMIVEASSMDRKLRAITGKDNDALRALDINIQDMRRYMSIKSVMSLLTGVLVSLWLYTLGVDNAIFMGLLAFFLNFVPVIGSIIASVPAILLALIQLGPGMAAVTALGYLVINVGVSNVIEPRYLGHRLGLSPLVVLLSLVFWGWLLGPVGMLLSVPLTMIVKVILENVDATRPVAILMGPPPRSPS